MGSHCALRLYERGYNVLVVDNLSNSTIECVSKLNHGSVDRVKFLHGDIRDAVFMDDVFRAHRIDCVIHFAAMKRVDESVACPLTYYDVNVGGTIALLQAMTRAGVRNLIFSSSTTVYEPSLERLTETSRLGPCNPYGRTKRIVEEMLRDVCNSDHRWRVESLRYFNPCGARPDAVIGEIPNVSAGSLTARLQLLSIGRLGELRVFGNDYAETSDGTCVRDYIHIEDVADAHAMAYEYMLRTPPSANSSRFTVHNLGNGHGASVLEVIAAFEEASGMKVPVRFCGRRDGDVAMSVCDPSAAATDLGWAAKRPLKQMMADAVLFQRSNPTLVIEPKESAN